MTVPQYIYVFAVGAYAVFFLLFARFFWWKRLAQSQHWGPRPKLTIGQVRQLAREGGRDLPRYTILVPARNEAAVIAKTIDHMAKLDYPKDHYELIVVTDEKEAAEAERRRPAAVAEVLALLRRRAAGGPSPGADEIGADAGELLTYLLTEQALREYRGSRAKRGRGQLVVPAGLAWLNRAQRHALLHAIAGELIRNNGHIAKGNLACLIERLAPGRPAAHLREESGALLGLAIPVVVAYTDLAGAGDRRLMNKMLREVARTRHRVTEEIISSLARMIGGRLGRSLDEATADAGALRRRLERAAVAALPTTQDIVEQRIAAAAGRAEAVTVKHVVVPRDFDGAYAGQCLGHDVPSTKGRALNYALSFVDPATEVCGFYDAESRPDPRTLLYVAWRRLVAPQTSRLLQGPVFQVRNLFRMSPLCKIAALYQAVSHEWYLPQLFHRLPFVGGTNLFITKDLVCGLGGYDHTILTEDLELGVRAYLKAGIWPEYLPYASSEQTPPTVRGFFRQRLRWGTGHLQVMDKLRRDNQHDRGRIRQMLHHLLVKGQLEWTLYQMATLVPPTILALYVLGWVDPNILPAGVRVALNLFTLVYFGFTFYIYLRYRGYVDMSARPRGRLGQWSVVPQLILLPLAAFMFPVPYSTAMVLKGLGREPRAWVKTPRTVE